ncbi:MAG TPA: hypothetical protein VJ817_10820 [Gemmatimonadales bacterium]|nr:hypothetical protein [Gemmatimonadales bacterium]
MRTTPLDGDAPSPDCLDDDALGALAEGTPDPSVRSAALAHLGSCARCRATLASLARALADPNVAREVSVLEAAPRPRWHRFVLPAAAAAATLLFLGPLDLRQKPADLHRSPTITNGSLPSAVTPQGAVAEVAELRWTPVEGADRYRVTVFDSEGRVVYEVEPVAAVAQFPDSVELTPGRRYLWKVEARVGFDRWVASDLVGFSLVSRRPR